jgi:hypothetical protein
MKLGLDIDIKNSHILTEHILNQIDIVTIGNPLHPNYLNSDYTEDIAKIKSLSLNKTITVNGPYIDLNPATPEMEIKKIVELKIEQAINYAISANAKEIMFLSTFIPQLQLPDLYDNHWIEQSIVFWKKLCAKYPAIKINLANTFEYNPSNLIEVYKGVDKYNFGLCLDVGHVLCFSSMPLNEWFNLTEEFTETIYLHSNRNKKDEHLNLFEGMLLTDEGFLKIKNKIKDKNIILSLSKTDTIERNINIVKNNFEMNATLNFEVQF